MGKHKIMRTLFVDTETTGFDADFGRFICAVCKEYRRSPVVIEAEVYDDRQACIRLRNKLEDYDIIVAFYGKGFDIPFLQSRLLIHNERRLEPRLFIDPYQVARNTFKRSIKRKSLESLADVLGLPDDLQKIKVRRSTWNLARDGKDEERQKVIERCIGDVLTLEAVYWRLTPYVKSITKYG